MSAGNRKYPYRSRGAKKSSHSGFITALCVVILTGLIIGMSIGKADAASGPSLRNCHKDGVTNGFNMKHMEYDLVFPEYYCNNLRNQWQFTVANTKRETNILRRQNKADWMFSSAFCRTSPESGYWVWSPMEYYGAFRDEFAQKQWNRYIRWYSTKHDCRLVKR